MASLQVVGVGAGAGAGGALAADMCGAQIGDAITAMPARSARATVVAGVKHRGTPGCTFTGKEFGRGVDPPSCRRSAFSVYSLSGSFIL